MSAVTEHQPCRQCGRETPLRDGNGNPECSACKHRRERAYDDYVDPLHWYHQHEPDRVSS